MQPETFLTKREVEFIALTRLQFLVTVLFRIIHAILSAAESTAAINHHRASQTAESVGTLTLTSIMKAVDAACIVKHVP